MIPDRLPEYTVRQIEHEAAKFLRKSLGDDFDIPIDVDYLLESLNGVDLDYWPGLKDNHGIFGAVFTNTENRNIYVYIDDQIADSNQHRNLYRMTVAEELAHIVLHEAVIRSIDALNDFRELQKHPDWSTVERNAKRFAAAILMPGHLVTREAGNVYGQLVSIAGYGNPEVIKKYLRNQLAGRFEVSPESMGYRLKEWPMKVYDKVDEAMDARMDYLP